MSLPQELFYYIGTFCDYDTAKKYYESLNLLDNSLVSKLLNNRLIDKLHTDTFNTIDKHIAIINKNIPQIGKIIETKIINIKKNEYYLFPFQESPLCKIGISNLKVINNYSSIEKINLYGGSCILDSYKPEYFNYQLEYPLHCVSNKMVLPLLLYHEIKIFVKAKKDVSIKYDLVEITNPNETYNYTTLCHYYHNEDDLRTFCPTKLLRLTFSKEIKNAILEYEFEEETTVCCFFSQKQTKVYSLTFEKDTECTQILNFSKSVHYDIVNLIAEEQPKLIYSMYINLISINYGMIGVLEHYH